MGLQRGVGAAEDAAKMYRRLEGRRTSISPNSPNLDLIHLKIRNADLFDSYFNVTVR